MAQRFRDSNESQSRLMTLTVRRDDSLDTHFSTTVERFCNLESIHVATSDFRFLGEDCAGLTAPAFWQELHMHVAEVCRRTRRKNISDRATGRPHHGQPVGRQPSSLQPDSRRADSLRAESFTLLEQGTAHPDLLGVVARPTGKPAAAFRAGAPVRRERRLIRARQHRRFHRAAVPQAIFGYTEDEQLQDVAGCRARAKKTMPGTSAHFAIPQASAARALAALGLYASIRASPAGRIHAVDTNGRDLRPRRAAAFDAEGVSGFLAAGAANAKIQGLIWRRADGWLTAARQKDVNGNAKAGGRRTRIRGRQRALLTGSNNWSCHSTATNRSCARSWRWNSGCEVGPP